MRRRAQLNARRFDDDIASKAKAERTRAHSLKSENQRADKGAKAMERTS